MANLQDPRKDENPKTVNEKILDRIIRHLLYLTRLQNKEAEWILEQVESRILTGVSREALQAVNRLIEAGADAAVITGDQSRILNQLEISLRGITDKGSDQIKQDFFVRLSDLAEEEVDFENRLFSRAIPVDMNFDIPSRAQLASWITSQPIDGKTMDEWFSNMSSGTVSRVNQAIRNGLVEGEGIDQIMRRIRGARASKFTDGVLQTTRRHAEALARTGAIHASNQATNAFYRKNDDLIKEVKVVVTLDSRTCTTCMGYEANNPYKLDKFVPPPFHVNCRCTSAPVVKSWREIGVDLDQAPEGTRASMNGQVPASLTYNEWLKDQPSEVIEEALGKTRAKLFMSGDLNVSAFTNRTGRKLTLDELRRKERDLFDD